MKHILFIDDEPARLEDFIDIIEFSLGSYSTIIIQELKLAEELISSRDQNLKLIVMDLMFVNESDDKYSGINAGINFYRTLKRNNINIPVLILTNRNRDSIIDFINEINKNKDHFFEKISLNPTSFLKIVTQILYS